ncbi:Protoheme IX farnesyltransferase [Candidatus Hepatincolaceae symbiont of Richtersius coronifer]
MKHYLSVIKPGIVFANLFTFITGFFMAAYNNITPNIDLLAWSSLAIVLILASSTTLNNYIDQDIDQYMARTHNRPSISGAISNKCMVYYATLLGVLGTLILIIFVNWLTFFIILIGYLIYIILYSIYAKRKTSYSTIIGSLAGGILPLAGYTSFSNQLDLQGIILFLIILTWQMPHFYAIGIFRLQDYQAAGIPILPVTTSIKNTQIHIVVWCLIFIIVTILPFAFGYSSYLYLVTAVICSIFWTYISYKGLFALDVIQSARKVFFTSLVVLILLFFSLMIDKILI